MRIILAIFIIFSTNAFSLEVDEKLTARIIRTSETRKTLMINRRFLQLDRCGQFIV